MAKRAFVNEALVNDYKPDYSWVWPYGAIMVMLAACVIAAHFFGG